LFILSEEVYIIEERSVLLFKTHTHTLQNLPIQTFFYIFCFQKKKQEKKLMLLLGHNHWHITLWNLRKCGVSDGNWVHIYMLGAASKYWNITRNPLEFPSHFHSYIYIYIKLHVLVKILIKFKFDAIIKYKVITVFIRLCVGCVYTSSRVLSYLSHP